MKLKPTEAGQWWIAKWCNEPWGCVLVESVNGALMSHISGVGWRPVLDINWTWGELVMHPDGTLPERLVLLPDDEATCERVVRSIRHSSKMGEWGKRIVKEVNAIIREQSAAPTCKQSLQVQTADVAALTAERDALAEKVKGLEQQVAAFRFTTEVTEGINDIVKERDELRRKVETAKGDCLAENIRLSRMVESLNEGNLELRGALQKAKDGWRDALEARGKLAKDDATRKMLDMAACNIPQGVECGNCYADSMWDRVIDALNAMGGCGECEKYTSDLLLRVGMRLVDAGFREGDTLEAIELLISARAERDTLRAELAGLRTQAGDHVADVGKMVDLEAFAKDLTRINGLATVVERRREFTSWVSKFIDAKLAARGGV